MAADATRNHAIALTTTCNRAIMQSLQRPQGVSKTRLGTQPEALSSVPLAFEASGLGNESFFFCLSISTSPCCTR